MIQGTEDTTQDNEVKSQTQDNGKILELWLCTKTREQKDKFKQEYEIF